MALLEKFKANLQFFSFVWSKACYCYQRSQNGTGNSTMCTCWPCQYNPDQMDNPFDQQLIKHLDMSIQEKENWPILSLRMWGCELSSEQWPGGWGAGKIQPHLAIYRACRFHSGFATRKTFVVNNHQFPILRKIMDFFALFVFHLSWVAECQKIPKKE